MKKLTSLLTLFLVISLSTQKATLSNNGYDDVLVAISPEIPEDVQIIENLKILFTKASEELYRATRHRAFMKNIKILLPSTWQNYPADNSVDEYFDDAEFKILEENPVYGDNPYTVQTGDCGDPGDFTHLTPWFVINNQGEAEKIFGKTEKAIVHEWAKLRWGVFEEYGYPGDDKFPLFYFQTTWTSSGQQDVLKPNLCTDTEVSGNAVDIVTGGDCNYDLLSGKPDENCYFIPDVNATISSSYMSLAYMDSVTQFCDDTEELFHQLDIPTKHNLYCDGRSTWSVILDSTDFTNGNNEAVDGLDTTPEFTILKPSTTRYVLVMDVSGSMVSNDENIPRDQNMLNAVRRWITYEVADGTDVGMVVFSAEEQTYVFAPFETIDDASRPEMTHNLDKVMFGGTTCIGQGLKMALEDPTLLNDGQGGVIILLTDGEQTDGCLSIPDVQKHLVDHKVKVVSIAMGMKADPAIEELSLATSGKSFYVDDSSGPGNFNDAFSGSMTYQPPDVMGNTNIVIFQKDWNNIKKDELIRGFFDIDASIGRDVSFIVEVKTADAGNICKEPINLIIVEPGNTAAITEDFKCSTSNFGVNKYNLLKLATEGRWTFKLNVHEDYASVSVKVESKSRSSSTDPIMSKCWIATGSQSLNADVNVKIAVVAEVTQGSKPVLGATVVAEVEIPTGVDPPIKFSLSDNGSGADKIKNDGTYSRYFAHYTGSGRFSVKCQVEGDGNTSANEGYTGGRSGRVYPQEHQPSNPLCCGSNALMPGDSLTKTGVFTRQAAGGSFQASGTSQDRTPPVRVTDLTIEMIEDEFVQVTFTAPGDDLDSDTPADEYVIKYSSTNANLSAGNFDADIFNTRIQEIDLVNTTLAPVQGGSIVYIKIKSEIFDHNQKYVMALRSEDDSGNTSPVSNIVQIYRQRTVLPHCPQNFFHVNSDDCLYFKIEESHKDFVESLISCEQIGGFLAEPKTTDELTMLLKHGLSVQELYGTQYWWIGLSDIVSEGSWKWINANLPATISNVSWAKDRPDTDPKNRNDCVFSTFENNEIKFYDTVCTHTSFNHSSIAPLCQCKADQCRSLRPACPRGFTQTDSMDCLYLINDPVESDFIESIIACEQRGGFLAEPKSVNDVHALQTALNATNSSQPWWIGLSDFYTEGDWTWINSNEKASSGTLATFWAPDRPDASVGNKNDCVLVTLVGGQLEFTDKLCSSGTFEGQAIGSACQCKPGECLELR